MKRRKFLSNSILASSGIIISKNSSLGGVNPHVKTEKKKNVGKEIIEIQIFAPSYVQLNEEFSIGVKLKCEPFFANWQVRWERVEGAIDGPFNKCARGTTFMDNVLPEWNGQIEITGDSGLVAPFNSFSFLDHQNTNYGKRSIRRLEGFKFNSSGFKSITIIDPETGIAGKSNPIYVDEKYPKQRIYWGDLHCHSFFSDGIRAPEELHTFARDETFFDFFALTDHTEILSDGQWEYIKYVCNQFNEPYRFVTFNGGEWTSMSSKYGRGVYGHHNFIYPGNDGPILRSSDLDNNNLEKLFSNVKLHGGIVMADHPGSAGWGSDWNHNYKNDVVRLVEVYNGGSHEMDSGPGREYVSQRIKKPNDGNFVVDGFKKGLKFGVTGVGDTHDGRPGDHLHSLQPTPGYSEALGPGLTGVWADSLTRESIFEALYNRHTYATTNNRTWLKYSINGELMGSEINSSDDLDFQIIVSSNFKILMIELIEDGEVVKSVQPNDFKAVWEFRERGTKNSTWYYVRVAMENEQLACSSPIWIN